MHFAVHHFPRGTGRSAIPDPQIERSRNLRFRARGQKARAFHLPRPSASLPVSRGRQYHNDVPAQQCCQPISSSKKYPRGSAGEAARGPKAPLFRHFQLQTGPGIGSLVDPVLDDTQLCRRDRPEKPQNVLNGGVQPGFVILRRQYDL